MHDKLLLSGIRISHLVFICKQIKVTHVNDLYVTFVTQYWIMNNRIAQILKLLSLSSSSFAAEIGVQRSSISHVLSGRNKPSLEFIQKIVMAYPEINIDWLITGNGTIDKSSSNDHSKDSISSVNRDKHIFPTEKNKIAKELSVESLHNENLITKNTLKSMRKIEKLILVYNDKTFEEIYPAD